MIRKVLIALGAIVLLLGGLATEANADSANEVREDSVNTPNYWLGGTATMSTSGDIIRDTNGTPNNNHDDKFNFGGVSVDVDLQTHHTWWGFVLCSAFGLEDNAAPYDDNICLWGTTENSKVNWTEITIRKLVNPDNPGAGYETHWQGTFNADDQTNFFLPQTNIDWDKKPFVRVEVDYENSYAGGNPTTRYAWLSAWEN